MSRGQKDSTLRPSRSQVSRATNVTAVEGTVHPIPEARPEPHHRRGVFGVLLVEVEASLNASRGQVGGAHRLYLLQGGILDWVARTRGRHVSVRRDDPQKISRASSRLVSIIDRAVERLQVRPRLVTVDALVRLVQQTDLAG